MVIVFIRIIVPPEKRNELSQTLHSFVEQVRKESGCLHAGLFENAENETNFLVVEEWETRKDSDAHLQSDLFTVFAGAKSLLSRPLGIVIHAVSCSKELEARTPGIQAAEGTVKSFIKK